MFFPNQSTTARDRLYSPPKIISTNPSSRTQPTIEKTSDQAPSRVNRIEEKDEVHGSSLGATSQGFQYFALAAVLSRTVGSVHETVESSVG